MSTTANDIFFSGILRCKSVAFFLSHYLATFVTTLLYQNNTRGKVFYLLTVLSLNRVAFHFLVSTANMHYSILAEKETTSLSAAHGLFMSTFATADKTPISSGANKNLTPSNHGGGFFVVCNLSAGLFFSLSYGLGRLRKVAIIPVIKTML